MKIHLNAIQLLVKQNVLSLIYDYLESKPWNKKVKTIKSNLLKYDKNVIKFCYKLRSRKNYLCKITSSKQLVLTKTTYVNFEKNTLGLNYEKKAHKNNFHWKTGNFLKFQKHINQKKNSHQPIWYPVARKKIGKS